MTMKQRTLKIVSNCLKTNIYSYLETNGGQSSNLYLNVVHFFNTTVFIRHLWQLKTVAFLHWCLICAVPLKIPLTKRVFSSFSSFLFLFSATNVARGSKADMAAAARANGDFEDGDRIYENEQLP